MLLKKTQISYPFEARRHPLNSSDGYKCSDHCKYKNDCGSLRNDYKLKCGFLMYFNGRTYANVNVRCCSFVYLCHCLQ